LYKITLSIGLRISGVRMGAQTYLPIEILDYV